MKFLRALLENQTTHTRLASVALGLLAALWMGGLALAGALLMLALSGIVYLLMRHQVRQLHEAVEQLAAGQLDTTLPHTNSTNELSGLARSIEVLQQEARQMAAQRWIKTHQSAIQAKLLSASNFVELARCFLTELAPLLNVGHAVFYLHEPQHRHLRLLAGYAFSERKKVKQIFALGHGLVGQCALERTPIVLTDPPEDYIHVGTSLGQAIPRAIHVLPVLHNDRLMAVIELATFDHYGPEQEALLDGLMPILGMSLEILEGTVKTRNLLAETQRQAEKMEAQQDEIKATEAWFREILESAPDGMLVVDDQGIIILANQQLDAMFEYPTGALLGQPIEVLVPEDVREAHVGWRNAFIHDPTKTRANLGLRAVSQKGDGFSTEVGLAKLPSVGGRGICVCVSVRDITEKKRTTQEIERQRATMSALLDAIPDPIYYKGTDGTYLGCNAAYARRVGKPAEEIVSRTDYDILPPEQAFAVRSADQHVFDTLTANRGEEWVELPQGEKRCLDTLRSPFHDAEGELLGMLTVGRDITKRKLAEEELQRARLAAEEAAIGKEIGPKGQAS